MATRELMKQFEEELDKQSVKSVGDVSYAYKAGWLLSFVSEMASKNPKMRVEMEKWIAALKEGE